MVVHAKPQILARLNETAILEMIRAHGPISRAEVARRLKLSAPTVTRIVAKLVDNQLVFEVGTGDSQGGRRPTLLDFNRKASLIAGVDLRSTNVVGALTDLEGEVLHKVVRPFPPAAGPETYREMLEALIADLLRSAPAAHDVRAIGIGAPALVRSAEGVVRLAPALGWHDLPLKAMLEARFDVPTFVENDVNLAALGEHWRGAARGVENFVLVSIGTGIGAGLVLRGELYRGATEAAGEVGYFLPDETYLDNVHGEFGGLESLASATALVTRAQEAARAGQGTELLALAGGDAAAITLAHIFQAASHGEPLSVEIAGAAERKLAVAFANIASLLDPEMLILAAESPELQSTLVERIAAHVLRVAPSPVKVVPSALGDEAVLIGAVALAQRLTSNYLFIRATPQPGTAVNA